MLLPRLAPPRAPLKTGGEGVLCAFYKAGDATYAAPVTRGATSASSIAGAFARAAQEGWGGALSAMSRVRKPRAPPR